jgi:ABC-2 type transport system permease protein
MWVIAKRELFIFFSSGIGYLTLGVYLTISTLFLWFFDTDFNILNAGFADLNSFFVLTPWILIFLIPALCMRSFSEERRTGTLELLLTKPVSLWKIILGKYLGSMLLVIMGFVPTLFYFFAVNDLKLGDTPLDVGSSFSAYLGLILVSSVFVAIGIFSSLLTKNQVTAYILSILLCFIQFFLWKGIADLMVDAKTYYFFNQLGIFEHYLNLRQGVISIKDLIYFIVFNYVLLYLSRQILFRIKKQGR